MNNWAPWIVVILGVFTLINQDRINTLESHLNTLAIATKHNVTTEQLDYQELLKRYKEVQYEIDVLNEQEIQEIQSRRQIKAQ